MSDTLGIYLGPDETDLSAQAGALPHASIAVDVRGNRGLLVMAYQGGAQGEHTYWQAGDEATLAFSNGRPFATAGLEENLLSYRFTMDQPTPSVVEVHWQDAQGLDHHARGIRTASCSSPAPFELPLTTLSLERCHEHIEWDRGASSENTLWRLPSTGHIWAGDVQPWPDAEPIRWQVARPWWSG
ncbi:YjbF family lipoprotein [Halomonas sp. YLGW01]|uniref:YjbF family lipoprotein n=1 Tax=Halomonas sp. YLGW01 TaxID=2773308 RepID=UPI00177C451E|nr:YjbF family lipoprotein [Halomonas sp. YLGW01]